MSSADTIFALATPPGRSGVAVLRLSGPQARDALMRLCGIGPLPRQAHLATFRAPGTQAVIDRGLALYFPAPRSFTGEDIVELQLHGSLAVIREMLAVLATLPGLRPAERGEFTRRAFLNGRMDLMEAEGLADLIDAETGEQKSQALRQAQGELSRYYDRLREQVIACLALLEAYIDFPDEEIPDSVLAQLAADIRALQSVIGLALQDGRRGERLRDGISVVILGAPNAGKSSLLNALARRDAAIVSTRAGTTRDLIEVHMDIAGYPIVLVDTAGIRDSDDEIEREGIRRALARADAADLRLVLFDAGDPAQTSPALLDERAIAVISKCDLLADSNCATIGIPGALPVSTLTGQGMDDLLAEMEKRIIGFFSSGETPLITRQRHRALLTEAQSRLNKALAEMPLELKCEELRQSASVLGKITGRIQVDEVLDVIFRRFCIGK